LKLTTQGADAGKRLDRFLQEQLPAYSRTRLQDWIRSGRVLVGGRPVKAAHSLAGGEQVEVEPAELAPLRAEPEAIPLEILYEDEDVVAVNKPAGMVVHAGAGCHSGTLVNALLSRFTLLSGVGGELRPGIVHRLDRYTSGVILVARHDAAHRNLAEQFAQRKVEKTYLALVHGVVKLERGKLEKPITRDPAKRIRMTARLGYGRTALTEYRVLKRFPGFTFLEVRIGTGRTHQIRVHLSGIGHPVVGDRLYGAPAKTLGELPLGRFFLHAHRVRFLKPSTGEPITVESPLPAELEAWMKGLGIIESEAS
jgi:23S rRNA pseudouridine1911/1915/1917 synthase